jgi:hypothetical protein
MWFLIAVLSFFLIVFLVVKAAARGRRRGDVGLQQGADVSLQGISGGPGEPADAGDGPGAGGGDWGD